jgi:hypothetical protein
MDVSCLSTAASIRRAWTAAACAIPAVSGLQRHVLSPGHVWSTAVCDVPELFFLYNSYVLSLEMYVLQQPVLPP